MVFRVRIVWKRTRRSNSPTGVPGTKGNTATNKKAQEAAAPVTRVTLDSIVSLEITQDGEVAAGSYGGSMVALSEDGEELWCSSAGD